METILRGTDRKLARFPKDGNEKWQDSGFFFIQAADTQFGMIEGYLEKREDPGWEQEIVLTNLAIKKVNAMNPKPEFMVVCGDLVDAMPGKIPTRPLDEVKRPDQIMAFKECFKSLNSDIPLICVCGNHDVSDIPTPDTMADYRRNFGDDYFAFWCKGVMFIVLNSQFYEAPGEVKDLAAEQDQWLEELLKEAKNYKYTVIFQHIPWFLRTPDEDKEYFNIEKELREAMLSKFHEAGVKAIFCGHYHRNAGGMYKDMELVVTSAVGAQLGDDKSGLRIVNVTDDSITHKYYALNDIPDQVEL